MILWVICVIGIAVDNLDCCQIGFDGNKVLGTYAFLQSINTKSMINYKYNEINKFEINLLP